jgi:tetratricopeptide (TPR) repeat protein
MGSILSVSFNPDYISVGASGAIFGLAGAALAIRLTRPLTLGKKITEPSVFFLLVFIVYNVIFGFVQTSIDNAAHIGGLLAGFILGYYFIVRQRDDARLLPFARILYLLFSIVFVLSVLYCMRPIFSPRWHLWYADQLYTLGEMDMAEQSYRRAVDLKPKNTIYRRELGRFLILKGKPGDALREFNTALQLGGDRDMLFYLSGVAALALGDGDLLWENYTKAGEIGYFNDRILVLLGNYYTLKKEWDNALDAYIRAIRLDPNNALGYQALLYLLTRYGEAENPEHLELIRKEIKTGEIYSPLYFRFLGAYYQHFRRFDKAMECYEKAMDKLVDDPFFHYDIARCLYKMNRFKEAEREINLLLASFPDVNIPELNARKNIILMMKLRILKKQQEKPELQALRDEIENNYRTVITRQKDSILLNNLAYHFADENYKIDEALELALEAAQRDPRAYILDTLAWCYYRSGQYKEALDVMNRALDKAVMERLLKLPMIHLDDMSDILSPDDGDREYYYHLGAILAGMKETGKSIEALNKALTNRADFDDYEDALDLYEQLLKDDNDKSNS